MFKNMIIAILCAGFIISVLTYEGMQYADCPDKGIICETCGDYAIQWQRVNIGFMQYADECLPCYAERIGHHE